MRHPSQGHVHEAVIGRAWFWIALGVSEQRRLSHFRLDLSRDDAVATEAFPRPSDFVVWKSSRCLRSSQPLTGCRAAVSDLMTYLIFCLGMARVSIIMPSHRLLFAWALLGQETGGLQLHASRAVLHLSIVPEPAPASSGIPGPGLPPGVQSLSLLGRTIGGSFAIEWDDSPWGPYMEALQSCSMRLE